MRYSFYEMTCIFFLYGFLGWCAEVIYAAVNRGVFVNRGFLTGPMCPVYGCGMLAVLLLLEPLRDSFPILFLGSMAITTAIELLVGILAKLAFHTRLWDYSDEPFNLGGYVCLKFSLLWGVGALVIVDILHPIFQKAIGFVPIWLGVTLVCMLTAILVADTILTVVEARNIPRRIRAVREVERLLSALSAEIGESLADNTIRARGKKDELGEKLARYRRLFDARRRSPTDRRLLRAFPHLEKGRYAERFERIKQIYHARRDGGNEHQDDAKDA